MRTLFDASATSPSPGRRINFMRLVMGAVTVVVLIVCLMGLSNLVEHLDAKEVMVIQYPSGTLKVCSLPGYYAQWFGNVTKYRKRSQFWFSSASDQGRAVDQSIAVRFNDGGHDPPAEPHQRLFHPAHDQQRRDRLLRAPNRASRRRSSGVPISVMRPFSRTRILSTPRMVVNRCATTKVVRPRIN